MKKFLLLIALALSTQAYASELPSPQLQLDKTLKIYEEVDTLPQPHLVLERELIYVPKTRIHQRIINGGTGIKQFRAVPESEYYKGN